MPRRKHTSCEECHKRHMKCDMAPTGKCSNCKAARRKCTRPAQIVFRHENGANVGITRNRKALSFAYDTNQDWMSSSNQICFLDESPSAVWPAAAFGDDSMAWVDQKVTENPQLRRKRPPQLLEESKGLSSEGPSYTARQLRTSQDDELQASTTDLRLPASRETDPISLTSDFGLETTTNRLMFHSTYFQLHPGDLDAGLPYFMQQGSNSAAMVAALDTAALLYVGAAFKVPEYMHQAQQSYTLALGRLRRELCVGRTPRATIFSAIHIMETCELFKITSDTNLIGWQHHALGNISLMDQTFGSAKEKETWDALSTPLHSQTRVPFSLWLGLSKRKRLKTHELFWTKCENHFHILRTALAVPGVLESADKAVQTATDALIIESLADLVRTQQRLHVALEKRGFNERHPPYMSSSIADLATSMLHYTDIEDLAVSSYRFSELSSAITYLSYWMCLLILQIARIDAVKVFERSQEETLTSLTHEANEYAMDICRTVAYCTLDAHGYAGKMNVIGPLALVSGWYRRERNVKGLEWCQNVASRLEDAGLGSPVSAITCT